jgi:hypothetical protein
MQTVFLPALGYCFTYFAQHETSREDDKRPSRFFDNALTLGLAYRFLPAHRWASLVSRDERC